ncbi:MAG: hypothetical protein PHG85_02075 [Candidatus Altiarchaeota archaeon]|nr:hypothetical protein [Candidatus Altiarchaeota archaeon]
MDAPAAATPGTTYAPYSGVRNPNTRSIISLAFLTALSLMLPPAGMLLVSAAGWDWRILIPAILPSLFLLAILAFTWISGMLEAKKTEEFLSSSRPKVRWTYTPEEWKRIIDAQWENEKDDWKLQLFGLTFIFWLVGSLVGIMGILDGSGDINPLAATAGGLIFGLALGIPIAVGSRLAVQWEYSHTNPQTAIGTEEIYYNNQYFKADGKGCLIYKAEVVKEGVTAKLVIETASSSLSERHGTQEWEIPIPAAMAGDIEAILLPRMRITKREEDETIEETQEAEGEQRL